jgi:hypothetical protein
MKFALHYAAVGLFGKRAVKKTFKEVSAYLDGLAEVSY